MFQPLADGKASGNFVVFADGFAGAVKEPGAAAHRPSGLAVAPDGALFISDDQHGRIWRVTFHGQVATTGIAAAPTSSAGASNSANVLPPEGIHPDAGAATMVASLPVPPGATAAEIAQGARIFHGQVDSGTCAGCHGSNAKGSPIAPDLTSGKWRGATAASPRSPASSRNGVPDPKNYRSPMPPEGGVQLSEADLKAVAAYVWAISHRDQHTEK